MKHLPFVLGFSLLISCGSPTGPQQGKLLFKIDNVSCAYTGTKSVTFYIATVDVGTETISTGTTSAAYLTKPSVAYPRAGQPVVQARIANYTSSGGALWTARYPVNVPANGTVTHIFGC